MNEKKSDRESCKIDADIRVQFREKLPPVTEKIIKNSHDPECFTHINYEPVHSSRPVAQIIDKLREILFPGYFSPEKLDPANMQYNMGQAVSSLFDLLSGQIIHILRHDCFRYDKQCVECENLGYETTLKVLESIPEIRKILGTDVLATYRGDPAANSHDEIIFSYPGIYAIMVYRVAHRIFELGIPLLPRIMSEHAHSLTGVDIHPGAKIDESFVIDHGTGVVIGETTEIGKNVRIYQGVTLGALSLPEDAGKHFRGKKRHPTIEDDVIIYSGATILGGDTVIGARAVIGGNVWITESVPPDTKVLLKTPELIYK
jgi:serine O-acetyltransferase